MISVSKIYSIAIRFRILFEMESYLIKPKFGGNATEESATKRRASPITPKRPERCSISCCHSLPLEQTFGSCGHRFVPYYPGNNTPAIPAYLHDI
jgi:hypothetical protein